MQRRERVLTLLAFAGFACLGLPDGVLGVAWPSLRSSFGQPVDAIGALLAASTLGYVVASLFAAAVLRRRSMGWLLAVSCLTTGGTLGGFAWASDWLLLVALAFVGGLAAGAIDTGINSFAVVHFPARTLHGLHAAYGLGASAGSVWMTRVLLGEGAWRRGYVEIGALVLLFALGFAANVARWPSPDGIDAAGKPRDEAMRVTLRRPRAWLGAIAFFLYVGIEATLGVWLFGLLAVGRGTTVGVAGTMAGLYWGGLLAGRLGFGLAPVARRPSALLPACIAGLVAASVLLALASDTLAIGVAATGLGLFAAPIFPALVGATPERLGAGHTANAMSLQVAAAALGQAGIPTCVGWLVGTFGYDWVPWMVTILSVTLLGVNASLRPVLIDLDSPTTERVRI